MKLNLVKKITALALSVTLAFSTTTVFATTFEDNGYRSQYIDYYANYSKMDINKAMMMIPVGSKFTPESTERLNAAWGYAYEVYKNPDATQEEINTAYIELMEALERLEPCKLDEALLNRCYFYCRDMYDKYNEYFTEASRKTLSYCGTDAQVAILYENTQEGINKITQEVVEKLRTLELATENSDIALWTEVEQITEYVEAYAEDIGEYYFDEIPKFKDFNGYRLVYFQKNEVLPIINTNRYGNYIFEGNNRYSPSNYGYLLVNGSTGNIITMEKGIENGILDLDKLFEVQLESPCIFDMHIIGDSDCDNQLSVKDATYIQKICAKILKDSNTYYGDNFNDFNNDGKVNIMDATEIQKALVN